ncbi:MAG TPA: penicillin acylase family protein [Micropepsaceae bacterium]|nr:penicillin acylase family protein [Micropepsaceae bacterium]
MKRWLKWIGLGLATLVIVAGLWLANFLRSVPSYDGTLNVAGVSAPVQILRDRYAIPHVIAASLPDAAFALGYTHAQDRLWQMEIARRFIQGRLSELFGASALGTDTMMRAMDLYGASQEAVKHLSPQSRQVLQAYADGVNSFLKGHSGPLPIEFTLAGDTPEFWVPADSIAVLKGMAMQLSGNAFAEAARASLIPVLGRRGVEDFFLPFGDAPLPAYLDSLYSVTQTGQAFGVPDITASDNWAVDGAHSVTGKPLLANDPHLGFSIPSVWYLAHLSFGDEDMVGGTLAGIPAIIAGRNRHFAWGETNTGPDTEDLYLERINPDNRREYQVPGGWAEFEARAEIIKVRFGADRRILVRSTRHGPVMPETTQLGSAAPPGYAVALAWTALDPDDTSFDALLGIDLAKNAADAKTAAKSFVTPMQNIVYADDSGEIGLMLPGRVPLRSEKNDSLGLVPAQGWDGAYDWQGVIPADALVAIENPPSGHVATANNDVQPEGYRYTLTREWEAPYRFHRIDELLAATPKHSLQTFRSIQTDIVDTYALVLKQYLIAAGAFQGADAAAAQLLTNWNGAMSAARPEPLIFAAWARALARRIYGDELGARFPNFWGYRTEFTLRVLDGVDDEQRWCDDRATPEIEDCPSRIRLALHDAVTELSQAYGSDPTRWRWGDAHKAVHREQPFGSFPVIGGFFNREVEMDGGAFTLLRADHAMAAPRPYAAIHGAGYRGIYDLADPDRSLFIISTGQSGNLFSSHYADLLRLWAHEDYITIPTTRTAVEAAAVNRLTLQPMSSATTHP